MKYYKSYSESHNGDEGEFICEVENGIITRQINIYKGVLYWATPSDEYDEEYFYTDQPEFEPTAKDVEITKDEFLNLWEQAINQ
jgi:hypothetical protein